MTPTLMTVLLRIPTILPQSWSQRKKRSLQEKPRRFRSLQNVPTTNPDKQACLSFEEKCFKCFVMRRTKIGSLWSSAMCRYAPLPSITVFDKSHSFLSRRTTRALHLNRYSRPTKSHCNVKVTKRPSSKISKDCKIVLLIEGRRSERASCFACISIAVSPSLATPGWHPFSFQPLRCP